MYLDAARLHESEEPSLMAESRIVRREHVGGGSFRGCLGYRPLALAVEIPQELRLVIGDVVHRD